MMELVKKHIHMNRRSGSVASQMTLDDDFNVPDTMEDVEQLILERGEIQIESAKNQGEKGEVRGRLDFRVLYRTPGGQVMTLAGNLPFEERVNMPGLLENDHIQAGWELDDLKLGIINSRKLNVKALVTLKLQAETLFDAEAAEDARFDGDVETLKKTIAVAALSARRKDTFRVREVLSLSGNKPDIDTLLWQDIRLRGVNTRPLDGRIRLDGELMVFAIYSGEAGQVPVGVIGQAEPLLLSKKLWDGDRIVMMTDGVLDALPPEREEETMKEIIMDIHEETPREMSRSILERVLGYSDYCARDDMTVLVAGMWKK